MRSVSRRFCRREGWLGVAILNGSLLLMLLAAGTHSAAGMPLVLPRQCLPDLRQLNSNINITVVGLSQAPIPPSGAMTPTAVVDLSPPVGAVGADGSFPLFMFASDVAVVQQCNSGVPIIPVAMYPTPSGSAGGAAQIAQVNVTDAGKVQSTAGTPGCLFVFPASGLPLLMQLNPGLQIKTVCASQFGTTQAGLGGQTALLNVQSTQGTIDPLQPLPMLLPVDALPALGQLNQSAAIDIINVIEMPTGTSSAILPVALVNIQQNPQALNSPAKNPPSPSADTPPSQSNEEQADDSGDDRRKEDGKGESKGRGKGHQQHGDKQGDR